MIKRFWTLTAGISQGKRLLPGWFLLVLLMILQPLPTGAQVQLIHDSAATHTIGQCIEDIYHLRFAEARKLTAGLRTRYPEHPVGPFLEGLILYWEYLPLVPEKPESKLFIEHMEKCLKLADSRLEGNEMEVEGVFFDLVAQGMLMMYFADNGLTGKVIPFLAPSYRSLKKGFSLQDSFGEFRFTTGLYSYYIEAYPEAYPAYKPVAALFPKGDKEKGLVLLEEVSRNGLYLKNEALVFLNHLYLSYENDPGDALEYIRSLSQAYPENYFYRIRYMLNLLALGEKKECAAQMNKLRQTASENEFVRMVLLVFDGYFHETVYSNPEVAREKYMQAISIGKKFEAWGGTYLSLAYAGMARISQRAGESREARSYYKKAEKTSKYAFILQLENY